MASLRFGIGSAIVRSAHRASRGPRGSARWLVALLLLPLAARAQKDAPPEPVLEPPPQAPSPPQPSPSPPKPSEPPAKSSEPPPPSFAQRYQSFVRSHKTSPEWTQDRVFTSTRVWLLDPGSFEAQLWFRTRVYGAPGGTALPTEFLLQQEVELGVWPHLQIDLYENLTFNVDDQGRRGVQQEGVQIEARIAIPSYYGQIPTNPVVYLEFHPRHDNPDRAEVRLLLGGAPRPWLYLAANPYLELNVEPTRGQYLADMEVGTTLAMGFRLHETFTLSAETKIGGDMLGDPANRLHFVWWAGPGLIWKPLPKRMRKHFKIMATCLIAIPPTDPGAQRFEPLVIVGSQW